MQEHLLQTPIRDWTGARITINIEVPWMKNSVAYQHVIDELELQDLKYLVAPTDLDLYPEWHRYMILEEWKSQNERVTRIVNSIAGQIANALTRTIGKSLKD